MEHLVLRCLKANIAIMEVNAKNKAENNVYVYLINIFFMTIQKCNINLPPQLTKNGDI